MTNPTSGEKIEYCEVLRDKIFEYLPLQAKNSLAGVEVKFWPSNHGEMMLRLTFNPAEKLLDIDANEEIYGPDDTITGSYNRGCELDSVTGEVYAYVERMVPREKPAAQTPKDWNLSEAENDASQFDQGRLNFLLNLFENI